MKAITFPLHVGDGHHVPREAHDDMNKPFSQTWSSRAIAFSPEFQSMIDYNPWFSLLPFIHWDLIMHILPVPRSLILGAAFYSSARSMYKLK